MAHNLGQICRYNGSVDDFYSVAEHSDPYLKGAEARRLAAVTCSAGASA
jgi:hypothetical protein